MLSPVGRVVISLKEDFLGPENTLASLSGHVWPLDSVSKQSVCSTGNETSLNGQVRSPKRTHR